MAESKYRSVLRFELRALMLPRQAPYNLSYSTSPFFVLNIFKIEAWELFPWAGFKLIPLISAT
jgi:hypothetical protein